jgi:hypothetical protein
MRSMKSPIRIALLAVVAAILAYAVTAARAQMAGDHMKMGPVPKAAQRLQGSVNKYKTQLTSQGKYTCCINPTCDFCAVHMGGCPCGKMAAMDKPVCRECKGGWAAGEGVISGKTAADIKVMPAMMGGHKM